jgi:hypothetical protein
VQGTGATDPIQGEGVPIEGIGRITGLRKAAMDLAEEIGRGAVVPPVEGLTPRAIE